MRWLFGEFTLDEERRQLFRAETPVSLEPKAYELLPSAYPPASRSLQAANPRRAVAGHFCLRVRPGRFGHRLAVCSWRQRAPATLHPDRPRLRLRVFWRSTRGRAVPGHFDRARPSCPGAVEIRLNSVVRSAASSAHRCSRRAWRSGRSRCRVHAGLAAAALPNRDRCCSRAPLSISLVPVATGLMMASCGLRTALICSTASANPSISSK
jgi:hypothetical protein